MDGLEQKIQEFIKANEKNMVEDLQSLMAIPSVNAPASPGKPYGEGIFSALEKVWMLCDTYGISRGNVEDKMGFGFVGNQQEHMAIVSHLDVVAPGEGWIHPPFAGTIKDGLLIGRGAMDDKSAAILGIYVLKFLVEYKIPLHRGVRVLFGTDEEVGMRDLTAYLQKNHPPICSLIPDVSYPVCYGEKGILQGKIFYTMAAESPLISAKAGVAFNSVPAQCTLVFTGVELPPEPLLPAEEGSMTAEKNLVYLVAKGKGGHASKPLDTVNAIGVAGKWVPMEWIPFQDQPFFRFLFQLAKESTGQMFGIQKEEPVFGKLTCVVGICDIKEGKVEVSLDIRCPLGVDFSQIKKNIQDRCQEVSAQFVVEKEDPTHYMDPSHPMVQTLNQLYEEVFEKKASPYVTSGGTYARKLPNAVGFGLTVKGENNPMGLGKGAPHQPEEFIPLAYLYKSLALYIKSVLSLDTLAFPTTKEKGGSF